MLMVWFPYWICGQAWWTCLCIKEEPKSAHCLLHFLRTNRRERVGTPCLSESFVSQVVSFMVLLGVGKTELCKALAAAYFGKEVRPGRGKNLAGFGNQW